jgi:mRNA interferase MazF
MPISAPAFAPIWVVAPMISLCQPPGAGFPLSAELPAGCLPKPSWVKISQIRTISAERIGKRIGEIDLDELDRTIEGLVDLIS